MSRVAQATMFLLVMQVLFLQTCAADHGNRVNSLEGQVDQLRLELRHMQNLQLIKESEQRRDQEAPQG